MACTVGAKTERAILHIEEAVAILRARQHAAFEAAEKAVPVAGDEAIRRIAQNPGEQLEEEAEELPDSAELFQDEEDGVGTCEETFVQLAFIGSFALD